ncbi:hypothetical protein BU25DRAFT_413080 [Macroventuria anomochaeta]|uniref:Uncharacterized protein n=1 Tax=Macroventuria anomochaeta TaxID=301207 RepID=A0ACB6RSE5_9PLEO|nr:uncharacterized protein BU25DRAFT_413080 [Macroventuria anomochaeta]KAF2624905.1 hypothetical protein BU25DRAFT_413080 [Macroventuria anomochaeta]
MAILSTRLSRYFSLSRRSQSSTIHPTSAPKICKSKISKPIIPDEEDTHPLTASSHQYSHSHSSSIHTISDADLRNMEDEKLSRRLKDDIDDILAQYQYTPTTTAHPTANPFRDTEIRIEAASPASTYSTASPIVSAKLERFQNTPPPAPSWEKVSFGRQTRLFGPEEFTDFGVEWRGRVDLEARSHKNWRGEFGKRGYAVL